MFNKSYNIAATERANKELSASYIKYNVKLLDDNIETLNLSAHALGINFLDSVCDSIDILERDYFGIQYPFDNLCDGVPSWKWLKTDKLIRKQVKGDIASKIFYLRVRFVPADISQMHETYTRYQLFLQIKQDIYTNRIHCSKDISVQLAGYSLQSELGDHNATVLKLGYVGEFRFVQDQTPSFEAEVATFHKSLRGIRSEDAEMKFITTASQLSQYGCDLYKCEVMDKSIQIGFHAIGISIFSTEANGSFIIPWNAVDRVSNKNKSFAIKVIWTQPIFSLIDGGVNISIQTGKRANLSIYKDVKSGFRFVFPTAEEGKEAWRSCIESHSFFRVRDPKQVQTSKKMKRAHSLFTLISVRTLFSGRRTLPELSDIRRRNQMVQRSFTRTPSKRYAKKPQGQSEKPSIICLSEFGRPSTIIHGKTAKVLYSSISSSKDKLKIDIKKDAANGDKENCDIAVPALDLGQFRPKSVVTQSVRLDKNGSNKDYPDNSTMPRKPRAIYSKSLSMDDERKDFDSSAQDGTIKSTNLQKKINITRPSSTNIEVKSPTISKTQSKSKLSSSTALTRNSLSNSVGIMSSSVNKQIDMDSCVEVTIKAQDSRFGFTIRGGSDTGSHVMITKVTAGSPSDLCDPKLNEGDQIIKINDRFADELMHEEIKEIIRSTGHRKECQLILVVKSRCDRL